MKDTPLNIEDLNHLLRLIYEADEDLIFWEKQGNQLMIKQYQHLKKTYCEQFAEDISKSHIKFQLIPSS